MKIAFAFMLALGAVESQKDQKVTLIGAPILADSDQKGKVLTDKSFKSEDGEKVTVTIPKGYDDQMTLAQLQEFIQQVGGRVTQIDASSETFNHAALQFIEEGIMPYAPMHYSGQLMARKLLGNGDANTVSFVFDQPFKTAPNLSLAMTMKPNTSVNLVLIIDLNEVARPVSATPA